MRHFFDWLEEEGGGAERPWLILGKGPSFSERDRYDLSGYRTLALNHVVREGRVDVAHAIDLDVIETAGEAIERQASVLVMPWIPHVKNRAGTRDLASLAAELPALVRLDAAGRLLWYDLSTTRSHRGGRPVVQARYFSAEAALSLLALAGVRHVRSLGVDGGAAYSAAFDDLSGVTRLNNRHATYDLQFEGLARTIMTTGVDYAPLNVPSPVKVFVGSEPAQLLAVRVLEHSIRKHASMTVEVTPLYEARIDAPAPKDPANRPRTPFSFQRFVIPRLCGFAGRAIYVDSDMQVFRDIRELWTLPFDGADLLAAREPGESGRRPQFSVMLLDCAALRWDLAEIVAALDDGRLTYETLMYEMKAARRIRAAIPPEWNSLERFQEGATRLLHYTDMPRQPWLSLANPLAHLWVRDLIDAVEAGAIPKDLIAEEAARGHVRPSLVAQVERRMPECDLLPGGVRELDAGFVPPHEAAGLGRSRRGPIRILRAAIRQLYRGSRPRA
ncbi:MAG TPA: glycosyltransferase [Candidatus Polarisedimenticolaceae bacterium]|nr:glycosyltransferase [Candidatus Polarisedimenticolaceae bacterium]